MALVMSQMPDVWRKVLAEHVPDQSQRCRECRDTAGQQASWPCQTYRVAQEAKWVSEGNLPGTGPHGPGPSASPRVSPPSEGFRSPSAGGHRRPESSSTGGFGLDDSPYGGSFGSSFGSAPAGPALSSYGGSSYGGPSSSWDTPDPLGGSHGAPSHGGYSSPDPYGSSSYGTPAYDPSPYGAPSHGAPSYGASDSYGTASYGSGHGDALDRPSWSSGASYGSTGYDAGQYGRSDSYSWEPPRRAEPEEGSAPYGSRFDAPYGASFGVDDRPGPSWR